MSSAPQRPPGGSDPDNSGPSAARDDALFAHLFASRPVRQRRLGPWIFGGLLHVPLLYAFFTTNLGERLLERAELIIRPVLTIDDNPPAISAPVPILPSMPPVEPPVGRRPAPPANVEQPPLPAPGLPNPTAIPSPPSGVPGQGQPGTPGTGTGSALDRMATPRPDARLFAPTNPERMVSGPEAARARLADRVRELNDSLTVERLAAERSTDWTVTDKDGKRWGVSPGKLHLGDITLPLPLAFNPPPGRRDEVNARNRNFAEIEAQAAREGIKDSFSERVKEIRKRKDLERAEKTAAKNGEKKKSGSD